MSDDRTSEFLSLARSLPQDRLQAPAASINSSGTTTTAVGRYATTTTTSNKPPSSAGYHELREFHKTAASISSDIASTSALLSELTKLVRSNSLFDDDSSQVATLVARIKQNIESLNYRLDQSQQSLNAQKYKFGSRNSQINQEATNISSQLQQEFAETTNSFKHVLQQRSNLLKQTEDKQRLVYGGGDEQQYSSAAAGVQLTHKPPVYGTSSSSSSSFPTLDLTSGMATGEPTSSSAQARGGGMSSLPRPYGVSSNDDPYGNTSSPAELRMRRAQSDIIPTYSGSHSSYLGNSPYSGSSAPLTPLDMLRMEQENAELQQQLIPDQSYLRERADAMESVESNIVELGTIFNKLAHLVSEHRDMVIRVEDNTTETSNNMEMSMQVLTDTLTNLRTNRALALKVFSVLVIFIIMFIIFFA